MCTLRCRLERRKIRFGSGLMTFSKTPFSTLLFFLLLLLLLLLLPTLTVFSLFRVFPIIAASRNFVCTFLKQFFRWRLSGFFPIPIFSYLLGL